MCALALETNTKFSLHLFLVLRYFVGYNNKEDIREYVSADFQRQKQFMLAENSKKANFINTLCLSAV
jgi:hypothetical protein